MLLPTDDTIAAITTAPGDAAISVIRISGKDALLIGERCFSMPLQEVPSHTARYGKILDQTGQTLDHVLLLLFRAPKSYTGEDTVELFCHGGSLNTKRILERVLELGARAAGGGEFTLRAYLNGKIDLAQAEAVQKLIGAENTLALDVASHQLEGALSKKIEDFKKALIEIAALLEAYVDFPEEGLDFASQESIVKPLYMIMQEIQSLIDSFHDGKIASHGIRLSLIGSPNVGKSSLMNLLLGKERAIVTPIPGTTRDLLEEDVRIGPLHFRLIDTAGIRETDSEIEKEGIRRSKEEMAKGDFVLFLLDASREISQEEKDLMQMLNQEKTLFIWNKIDQKEAPPSSFLHQVSISAKEKIGIDALKTKLDQMIWRKGIPAKGSLIITELRHKTALVEALSCLQKVDLEKMPIECLVEEIKGALYSLSSILGSDISEEILSSIFSKFCVGK